MTTALISHSDCLDHVTPDGHPESVARLKAINATLADFDLLRIEAPLGKDAHILRAHPAAHIERIKTAGIGALDPDTHMSAGSLNAAYRGVGAITTAVDMVIQGQAHNAFCAIRPPGHHAELKTPMGFCLFGNIAIGAKHALEAHGLSRVAIMDFDVHHGNGTQNLVWDDARIFFASTHQMPLYPGSGAAHERGAHDNVLNVPLDPDTGGAEFRAAMEAQILPAIDAFQPELILISAGFDAHRADPLANLNWVEEDFVWATNALCDLADKHCAGRVVSTLEGGYNLDALAASCALHVNTLMERGK
ncbi:MAG: histone deacetylase family protein [Paracoccaceae bacterium]